MKNLLLILFPCFSLCSFSQINTVMPPEANTFYGKAMPAIKSRIKNIIERNALKLKGRIINSDSLSKALAKKSLLKNATPEDLQAIVVLIMVQVYQNADADLKNLVIHMSKSEEEISTGNAGGESVEEKRVDRILANKSRIAEEISLVMKRISGSQDVVIDNLK
ncbi:MAG TPA: hypothetical protein VMU83_10340 [Hanamia sp.]|nr:hypothetical protein [Hanamia sp.]